MPNHIRAVIAAGGTGQRVGLGFPKSCLIHSGHSLAYWNALSLHLSGIQAIDVYINSESWAVLLERELSLIPECRIVVDKGYKNTFLLFKEYYRRKEKILFVYGHSPQAASWYRKFSNTQGALVVSNVSRTSKRQPIPISDLFYAEPPYLIEVDKVNIEMVHTWSEFFKINRPLIDAQILLEIEEFNYRDEWFRYELYLADNNLFAT
jgi:choline kinase